MPDVDVHLPVIIAIAASVNELLTLLSFRVVEPSGHASTTRSSH